MINKHNQVIKHIDTEHNPVTEKQYITWSFGNIIKSLRNKTLSLAENNNPVAEQQSR